MSEGYTKKNHPFALKVSDEESAELKKLFARSGAKTEFLERFSSFGATEAKLNQIITTGDMYTFFGYLVAAGPVFRVEWNRNNSFSARSVVFYQFAGRFFSSALTSRLTVLENYPTLKKAAQMHAGKLNFSDVNYESGWNAYGVYLSERTTKGLKLISPKKADEIVSILSGLNNIIVHSEEALNTADWGDVPPDKMYFDPAHDNVGKAVRNLQNIWATHGKKDVYFEASRKFRELLESDGYVEMMFPRGYPGFRGVTDSVVMRVGLKALGNLKRFRGKWIRMCFGQFYGFNVFLLVKEIKTPSERITRWGRLISATGPYTEDDFRDYNSDQFPPHWKQIVSGDVIYKREGDMWIKTNSNETKK